MCISSLVFFGPPANRPVWKRASGSPVGSAPVWMRCLSTAKEWPCVALTSILTLASAEFKALSV